MQAEDIIQQKEWQQLSQAEKEIVFPLAETEAEYNLLKRMLLVSQEEAGEVPVMGNHIKEKLAASFPPEKKDNRTWLYAAASVVIIALAAFFLMNKEPKEDEMVVTPPPVKKEQIVIEKDKPVIQLQQEDIAVIPPVKKTIPKQKKPVDNNVQNIKVQDPEPGSYATIITSVGNDSALLALVTEVY